MRRSSQKENRQHSHGATIDSAPAQGEGAGCDFTQGAFNSHTCNTPDPMLEYSMDDATSDPSSNNPTPFHVGSFVHVAGPSSHYSRRGLEKCFDFTTGLAHCFRNQVEPKMWHALLHDEQNCIVQEGNPHLPMSLNLAFVTAILAILKITLNAILAEHPSQLPQSTSAVESVLDRIKPHVDKHLKSIDTPASPVHILYDIPLLERSIHDGKERTVQGLLTLEFYRAPGRKTAPWHRKCVLKSMNVPWYKGVKLQHKYEFSDETYSPPLVTADELNNVIQVPTLESVSASNDFEFVATSTDLDVVMDQDIDVSASSTQSASHLARLVDDVLMKDGSNPWVVTGTSSFPPVPSRCNSLELDSDIWAPLAGPYVGTLESMLPSKPLSNPGLNEALPSPPIVARLSAVYTSPEQNVYSDPIHHPTDEHRRCNSPENIDLDGNEDGQDISGKGGEDNHSQLPQQGAKLYYCPHPGCNKSYRRKSSLRIHGLSSHQGFKIKCSQCPGMYKRPADLSRHIKSFHRGEIWCCLYCNKRLKRPPMPAQRSQRCPKRNGYHVFEMKIELVHPARAAVQDSVHIPTSAFDTTW